MSKGTPKTAARRPRSAYKLKVSHEEKIKRLEDESVDAICLLFENAKDGRVFKVQMERLVNTVAALNAERNKVSLLNAYFLK